MSEQPLCELCGEPMPIGEEMFNYHGYSGPCPKPPLERPATEMIEISKLIEDVSTKIRAIIPAHDWRDHLWLDVMLQDLALRAMKLRDSSHASS